MARRVLFCSDGGDGAKWWKAKSAGALVRLLLSLRALQPLSSLVAQRGRISRSSSCLSEELEDRSTSYDPEKERARGRGRERERRYRESKTMKKLEGDEHQFFLLFLHPGSTSFSVARSLAWPLLLQQQLRLLQRLRLPEMQAKVREEPVKKDETKDAPGARADGWCLGLLARLLTWPLARLERVGVDPDLLKKKKNSKTPKKWSCGSAPRGTPRSSSSSATRWDRTSAFPRSSTSCESG